MPSLPICVVLLAGLILVARSAEATVIVALRSSGLVVLAADSRVTSPGFPSDEQCKIRVVEDVVFAMAGPYGVEGSALRPSVDFWTAVERSIRRNLGQPGRVIFDEALRALAEDFNRMIQLYPNALKSPDITQGTTLVLVARTKDAVDAWVGQAVPTASGTRIVDPRNLSTAEIIGGTPDILRAFHPDPNEAMREVFRQGLVPSAARLVELQAKATPDKVGGGVAEITVSPAGIAWIRPCQ